MPVSLQIVAQRAKWYKVVIEGRLSHESSEHESSKRGSSKSRSSVSIGFCSAVCDAFCYARARHGRAAAVLAKPGESPSVAARPATDRRVTLDVQVTDKSGAPIRGLQQQDFTLLDDKQPQKIVSFQAVDAGAAAKSDPPIEIILVADSINTTFHNVAYERDEVKKFLLQNGGKLA